MQLPLLVLLHAAAPAFACALFAQQVLRKNNQIAAGHVVFCLMQHTATMLCCIIVTPGM